MKAFVYNADSKQREIAYKSIKYLTNTKGQVIDLRNFDPVVLRTDSILVFGEKAKKKTNHLECQIKIILPDISRLDSDFEENSPYITEARQKLKEIKKSFNQPQGIDIDILNLKEELPTQLTAINQVSRLEAYIRQKGIDYWKGLTTNGKTIKVTLEPCKEKTADINLTFAELLAVIGLREAFQAKELEIVYSSSPRKSIISSSSRRNN